MQRPRSIARIIRPVICSPHATRYLFKPYVELLEPRNLMSVDGVLLSPPPAASSIESRDTSAFTPHALADDISSSQPSIIVFMIDDLDEMSLDIMANAGLMPNFDTYIASTGIHFQESFVTNSMCCPSRATFLTGQYSHNSRVLTNFEPHGGVSQFDDTSTVATWLQSAGYQTAHLGKYLNGYGSNPFAAPEQPQNPTYVPGGWDEWHGLTGVSTYLMYGYNINHNGVVSSYGDSPADYQTDVLAARAATVVEQADPEKPLFMSVNTLAPHVEYGTAATVNDYWRWTVRPAPRHDWRPGAPSSDGQSLVMPLPAATAFNEVDVTDKPQYVQDLSQLTAVDRSFLNRQFLDRLASLRAVDDLIGTVVTSLQNTNRLDDSVLIFTSDNGYLHGEHRLPQKGYPYEPAIRVPLYVKVPWSDQPSVFNGTIVNNDLAPTLAGLAGAHPDIAVDGYSWANLLQSGTDNFSRKRFLIEHWQEEAAFPVQAPSYYGLRTVTGTPWTFAEYRANLNDAAPVIDTELYNLSLDPDQLLSLHDRPPLAGLMNNLRSWTYALRGCSGSVCRDLETATSLPSSLPSSLTEQDAGAVVAAITARDDGTAPTAIAGPGLKSPDTRLTPSRKHLAACVQSVDRALSATALVRALRTTGQRLDDSLQGPAAERMDDVALGLSAALTGDGLAFAW